MDGDANANVNENEFDRAFARRASDRKREETNRMAQFMQGALARTKKRRIGANANESPSNEAARPAARTDDELAALAAQFHDLPRAQWPADVLEYVRQKRRSR